MSTPVQERERQPVPSIEAGVIEDARRRRRLRRIRSAYAALAGLVIAAGLIGGLGGTHRARRLGGERRVARQHLGEVARSLAPISPALEGGSYGWAVHALQGGSCCTLPTVSKHGLPIGVTAMTTTSGTSEAGVALLADRVRQIRVGARTATLTTLAALPYGMRLVRIGFAREGEQIFREGGASLVALGAHGEKLGNLGEQEGFGPAAIWWKGTEPAHAGPCRISVRQLPAHPEWGHIAASVKPYPRKIIGRAFFSCASAEYYLHNWPLETAILLDAQRPGAPPAAIPGMQPVHGAPGIYDASGSWNGELTARRGAEAWVVVAGGSGLRQRLEVLRHLSATITPRKP